MLRLRPCAIPFRPTKDGELAPLSLYARQKVAIEQLLLGASLDGLAPTCLRLATLYGAAPRMRFEPTVNEFTRDLWAARWVEVFGKQFCRPTCTSVMPRARSVSC